MSIEGMALALARRFEPFSQGRGFITRERVEEIEIIAALHGIHVAPFFNAEGPLEEMRTSKTARRWGVSGTDSQTEVHPVLNECSIR
jgi:hypothetical protein